MEEQAQTVEPSAAVARIRAALRALIASSKQAFKSTVLVRLDFEWARARQVHWEWGPIPVIHNLGVLRDAEMFSGVANLAVTMSFLRLRVRHWRCDWELVVFHLGGRPVEDGIGG